MPTIKKTIAKPVVKKAIVKPAVKKAVVKKEVVKAASITKKAVIKDVAKKEVKVLAKETTLKQSVYDTKGHLADTITLPKEIFGAKVNNPLMAQAVRVYLANQRRGTVKTKSRGEVKISTKKIYRQKGTGRARHGAASAPIFVGGGIAFGPKQRDYSLSLNQKARRASLFSALTTKLNSGEIKIVKGFEKLEPKTKLMAGAFNSFELGEKKMNILFVTPKPTKEFENIVRSARNIKGINIMAANILNTYEVLKSKNIVFMTESIESLKETYLKEN